ncbi:MAG: twitching motility protein PilT, partial [Pirellulaceae bacterium]|nr:twitching motility protein PilT [Pirellulaceae bacterium]
MATVEAEQATVQESNGAPVEPSEQLLIDKFAARLLQKRGELEVDKLFRALVKLEGSDLHLKVDRPPLVRVDGELRPLNRGPINAEEMVKLLVPMMNARSRNIFEKDGGADFAYTCDVDGTEWRFRINMLTQLGKIGLVARRINNWIPDFEGLFLPASVERLCNYDQG